METIKDTNHPVVEFPLSLEPRELDTQETRAVAGGPSVVNGADEADQP